MPIDLEDPRLNMGVNDDPGAAGQDDGNPDDDHSGDRLVPLAALEAERRKRQEAEERLLLYQAQLRQTMSAAAQPNTPAPQTQAEDFLPGLDDDEPVTKAEISKALRALNQRYHQMFTSGYMELKFLADHPDYEEVLGVHLQNVLKDRPDLLAALRANPNPVLAYEIGKTDPAYQAKKKNQQASAAVEKVLKNQRKPGSASQVGGGGIDPADRFRTMTPSEVRAHAEKVKRGVR